MAKGWTTGLGTPQGGEAQAVEELQGSWADLRRRLERVGRAEREGERPREQAQESGGSQGRSQLQPFRQPAIPPEMEREMQATVWRQIRDEAARLAERDGEVAAPERRVREEEGAVARGAHRVIPNPKGGTPPRMCREDRSLARGPEVREERLGKSGESGAG